MPWKLILFLLCLVITTFFIGFNLENSCNINVGFKVYENVPIFLSVLVSFASGAIIAFLFMIGKKMAKVEKKSTTPKEPKQLKAELKKASKKTVEVERSDSPAIDDKPKKTSSLFGKSKDLFSKKAKAPDAVLDTKDQTIVLDDTQGKK